MAPSISLVRDMKTTYIIIIFYQWPKLWYYFKWSHVAQNFQIPCRGEKVPFWHFFRLGQVSRALLVRPWRIPHRTLKNIFAFCADEFLAMLGGKIRVTPFQSGKITVCRGEKMPFWQFFRLGRVSRALLVRPWRIPHRILKIIFAFCANEFLAMLGDKIRVSPFQSGKITVCT